MLLDGAARFCDRLRIRESVVWHGMPELPRAATEGEALLHAMWGANASNVPLLRQFQPTECQVLWRLWRPAPRQRITGGASGASRFRR